MTDEDIEESMARHQRYAEQFCADLGLPPPKPWTVADELAFRERLRESDAQMDAYSRAGAAYFGGGPRRPGDR